MADGTVRSILIAIETKCSERKQGRLQQGEIEKDLLKLDALREEAQARSKKILPIMFIVDTAIDKEERMRQSALKFIIQKARALNIGFLYLPPQPETPFQSVW